MLKILYAGSPAVSATVLENLIASGKTDIVGVLTNAPAPAGRSGTCKPTPVAQAAHKANIRVLDPEKLDAALREKVAAFRADI